MTIYVMEVEENEWSGEEYATIIRIDHDGSRTEVGWIGSEPEDNTHYRAYSWILPELNKAFELGLEHGKCPCGIDQ